MVFAIWPGHAHARSDAIYVIVRDQFRLSLSICVCTPSPLFLHTFTTKSTQPYGIGSVFFVLFSFIFLVPIHTMQVKCMRCRQWIVHFLLCKLKQTDIRIVNSLWYWCCKHTKCTIIFFFVVVRISKSMNDVCVGCVVFAVLIAKNSSSNEHIYEKYIKTQTQQHNLPELIKGIEKTCYWKGTVSHIAHTIRMTNWLDRNHNNHLRTMIREQEFKPKHFFACKLNAQYSQFTIWANCVPSFLHSIVKCISILNRVQKEKKKTTLNPAKSWRVRNDNDPNTRYYKDHRARMKRLCGMS